MNKWTALNQDYPPVGERVWLTVSVNGKTDVITGCYKPDKTPYWDFDGNDKYDSIIAWTPLVTPEPYGNEAENVKYPCEAEGCKENQVYCLSWCYLSKGDAQIGNALVKVVGGGISRDIFDECVKEIKNEYDFDSNPTIVGVFKIDGDIDGNKEDESHVD